MAKRQSNIKYLMNLTKYTRKTDEQKDLIQQAVDCYASSKIHKLITAEKMINQIMNTTISCRSVVKQLPKLENKAPVYKTMDQLIQFITIKEQPCILDGLICTEPPNVEVLDKLLNSDLLNTFTYDKDEFGKQYENERKHIESYRSKVNKNGRVLVKYKNTTP